jgi:hypothetical protein
MITDKLFLTDPFEFNDDNRELFIKSFKENCAHHYENNDFFKFIWDREGFLPRDIKSEQDLTLVPYIMVNIFKHHELKSCPDDEIVLSLGSSGTTGQRSMIYLDQKSLDQVKHLAYSIHESLGMTDTQKYNYLCFTYDPKIANDLGTAFTDELLTSFTGKNEVYYTFQHDGSDFQFNEKETLAKLKEFEQSSYPTRILGFPAFLYQLIEKYDISFDLGDNSWVQTGGGWKNHQDKQIPKKDFRKIVSQRLKIPEKNIRDLFGMVEHGIPYVDAWDGELRVPNFARVIIRDPKTLAPLDYGKRGLVQFLCSYNTSFPAPSLLTTDYGRLIRNDDQGDTLQILGRAGNSKHKGCAIKAMESFL